VCNGAARSYIGEECSSFTRVPYTPQCFPKTCPVLTSPRTASDSTLSKLLEESLSLQPDKRAKILEDNEEVESAYATVARQGTQKSLRIQRTKSIFTMFASSGRPRAVTYMSWTVTGKAQ
jgi:hypothetical protein